MTKMKEFLVRYLIRTIEHEVLAEKVSFKTEEEIEFKIHELLDTNYNLKNQQQELEKEIYKNKLLLKVLAVKQGEFK